MDSLEKILKDLPQPKLSARADFKIKTKIQFFIFSKKLSQSIHAMLVPQSLVFRVAYVALLVVVVLGSTAVYAANNDNITPGDTLYPLKKTVENVEQQLALTKSSQVNNLNKLSERRVKEALNLAQEHLENNTTTANQMVSNNINETINEAVNNIDEAVKTSKKIGNNKNATKIKDEIKKKNENMIKYLDDIENIAKTNNDTEVSNRVTEAKKTIKQYNDDLDKESGEKRGDKKKEPKKESDSNSDWQRDANRGIDGHQNDINRQKDDKN